MKRHTIHNKAGVFLVALLVVGCTDTTAPVEEVALREQHRTDNVPGTTISQSNNAPALETYRSSFVAVQGAATTFAVNYVNGDRFMELVIPDDAQLLRPDGLPAENGETVTITLEIHPSLFSVKFGSDGSTLDAEHSATLTFFCKHTDDVGRARLRIWYQPASLEGWRAEPTSLDLLNDRLDVAVREFSNYAVAW